MFNTFNGAAGSYPTESTNGTLDLVAAAAAPVVPAGVTATASAGLQVAFNASNAASQPSGTTYNLLRGTTSGGESTTPVATGITSLPYTFTESAAATYFYQLTATSGNATSAASAEVSATAYNSSSQGSNTATATAQVPAPGAVTNLTATFQETSTTLALLLSYTLPASGQAPASIQARYSTTSAAALASGGGTAVQAASASSTSVLLPSLAHNTDYYAVIDLIGSGGTTTSSTVHVKSDTSPVTNLAVTGGNGMNNGSFTPSPGTIATQVFAGPHSGTLTLLMTLGAGVGTFTDTTAVNGVAKDYQVFELN